MLCERNVRLAVLYGSVARRDDAPDSGLDLLVSLGADGPDAAVKLTVRLERAAGHDMDITTNIAMRERPKPDARTPHANIVACKTTASSMVTDSSSFLLLRSCHLPVRLIRSQILPSNLRASSIRVFLL